MTDSFSNVFQLFTILHNWSNCTCFGMKWPTTPLPTPPRSPRLLPPDWLPLFLLFHLSEHLPGSHWLPASWWPAGTQPTTLLFFVTIMVPYCCGMIIALLSNQINLCESVDSPRNPAASCPSWQRCHLSSSTQPSLYPQGPARAPRADARCQPLLPPIPGSEVTLGVKQWT